MKEHLPNKMEVLTVLFTALLATATAWTPAMESKYHNFISFIKNFQDSYYTLSFTLKRQFDKI